MTNPYRALCAELVDAIFTPNPYSWEDSLYEAADRARALLAQPESIEDRIAKADAAIEASMERIRKIAATPARDLDHTQSPADKEVAELVEWLRLESEDWLQANPRGYQGARLTRAAELLERLASDNAGLTAAADSLWADNVSLLDDRQ
jgi:hypothetical protein